MLPFLTVRIAILLAGCGAAAYTDARTGYIFDKTTYPMIAAGILLNLIEQEWMFLAIGAVVFALGYVIYYMGKFGGGDVKLFTGIALLLPFFQGEAFLLNSLFAASILAVTFYSIYYVVKYARQGIKWNENRQGIRRAMFFGAIIAAYLYALSMMEMVAVQSALMLSVPLLFAVLFIAFEKGIRESFFLKQVSLGKLEEDEVVAAEFLKEKEKKALGLMVKGVLGEKEIAKLRAAGARTVPVYRNMPPFGPFILLGVIAALAQPDLIGLLFS